MRVACLKAAAIVACLAIGVAAGGAGAAVSAEQAVIDKAGQAYASKLKADAETASNQAVAAREHALVTGPGSQVLGNPQGDVTVIEFFDYTCPFCKAAEPRVQQLLKDDRNVKLVVIEFPILRPESKEVGLDVDRLRADMNAPEIADAIIGNFNHARALRITTTPTFIIGTRLVTESSATLDFAKAVAAARATAK